MIDAIGFMAVFGAGALVGLLFAVQIIAGAVRMTIKRMEVQSDD